MTTDVQGSLTQLGSLSRPELLQLWKRLFGKPVTGSLRREVLIPCIAYRIQENAYGGSSPEFRTQLQRLRQALRNGNNPRLRTEIKPGTRLLRRWKDEMHEVLVSNAGYEYRGAVYKSLSVIARKITHTRWSGPLFFGLHKGRSN